ncbi:hypothetical protein CEXT_311511 [Caerostris extrusa]|uniref:Uncharacterized protein n=1 Tax=Caerostris extrusa TaxID=172846 RepID=A0AAV4WU82_CAEEX|nr:hypothetical protein CEXT_311511 [Caerostris extrusa]
MVKTGTCAIKRYLPTYLLKTINEFVLVACTCTCGLHGSLIFVLVACTCTCGLHGSHIFVLVAYTVAYAYANRASYSYIFNCLGAAWSKLAVLPLNNIYPPKTINESVLVTSYTVA